MQITAIPVERQLEAMKLSEELMHLFNLDAIWTRLLDKAGHVSAAERQHAIRIGTEMKNLLTKLPKACGELFRANAKELQAFTIDQHGATESEQKIASTVARKMKDLTSFENEIHDDAQKDIDLLDHKLSELHSARQPPGDLSWGCGLAIVLTAACALSGNEIGAVAFAGVAVHHCR